MRGHAWAPEISTSFAASPARAPASWRLSLLAGVVAALWLATPHVACQEIAYWEDFALAEDRNAALKQLIPGTEDYYYFHGLHYQNTSQLAKVDELLTRWLERHGRTNRYREIETRQALLMYVAAPQRTLDFIRSDLNLRFDHQRVAPNQKPDLPTQFDNSLLDRERLFNIYVQRKSLLGFEPSADQWLVDKDLSPEMRRLLLQRMQRPDLTRIVDLVAADLQHPRSGGFGSLPIHRALLRSQLDELAKRRPRLLQESAFVRTYLTKLAPNPDQDLKFDEEAKLAHLERLERFVQGLAPVHNSLKAHVLYRRLAWDRSHGRFDRERFEAYLKLPRNVPYVNQDYLRRDDVRKYICNLSETYPETGLPIVGNDEPLVRSYLLHFFVEDASYEQYLPLVQTSYLKEVFAEAKVVNNVGDSEQWASLLPPQKFQQLRDRVDLDFVETNRRLYSIDDDGPVVLDLHVRNVRTLLVKIFKVNTEAYYRDNGKEVNTDIALDGLAPNWERTIEYDAAPLHRVRRHFAFPELSEPGVYVIDFIGNGRSSRAVIQKGQLRVLDEVVADGQQLTILDDQHQLVTDASVLLGGKVYRPDEAGRVLLPFATQPGQKSLVLFRDGAAYLARLEHRGESYELRAGIYIDKESMLGRRECRLLIRPQLRLNGNPISVGDLEEVALKISARDFDDVVVDQRVPNLKLRDDRATVHDFLLPPRVASLDVTLTAKIKRLSQTGDPLKLSASQQILVNNFDPTHLVGDVHLAWIDNRYALLLYGRSGEPLQDQPLRVQVKHRDFTQPVTQTLMTNQRGEVDLGPLENATLVSAQHGGRVRKWPLGGDGAVTPSVVHGLEGEEIQLPLPAEIEVNAEHVSLLEIRGGQFVTDARRHVKREGGLLLLQGLPAGNYSLVLKRPDRRELTIRIAAGPRRAGYACGASRLLEIRTPRPISLRDVRVDDGKLTAVVQNYSEMARVHVLGARLKPAFDCVDVLGAVADIPPMMVSIHRRPALLAEGRRLGEEHRYILERRLGSKFPGNMLERPSLLLNPWALRTTEAQTQAAKDGEAFEPAAPPAADAMGRGAGKGQARAAAAQAAGLDFLATTSVVLANVPVDEKGRIAVDLADLGDAQQVRVVAADPWGVVQRSVSLPRRPWRTLDLRLAKSLPVDEHFVQRQAISLLEPGQTMQLDAGAARVRLYDSLESVYQLLATLNPDAKLREFRFVLQWPTYDDDQKRTLYSKHACHELNFFLAHKDPEFFREVIVPYLVNKYDKTFMDHYLIEDDLLAFAGSWDHEQLNIVERILLGQRLPRQQAAARRHVRELFELREFTIQDQRRLFEHAVRSRLTPSSGPSVSFGLDSQGNPSADLDLQFANDPFGADARQLGGFAGKEWKAAGKMRDAYRPNRPRVKSERGARQAEMPAEEAEEEAKEQAKRKSRGLSRRSGAAQDRLYQVIDKTMEWAENNYYKRPIKEQNASFVQVNGFWNDYAQNERGTPLLSKHFAQAAGNATESMLALAIIDLPFEAAEHEQTFEDGRLTVEAGSRAILLHEQIQQAALVEDAPTLLVSQRQFELGAKSDKDGQPPKLEEFLKHSVYGTQIIISNPSSATRQLEVLCQIPQGAVPVAKHKPLNSIPVELKPYQTATVQGCLFYFPAAGEYPMYPPHVSQNGELLAALEPQTLQVVETLTKIDRTSWDYISQNGTSDEVLQYLQDHNLQKTQLNRIAFRMQDREFFRRTLDWLALNRAYDSTLWSYSVAHNAPLRIDEFLRRQDGLVSRCGAYLDSEVLHLDPVERRTYQHLDYRPLVNARRHRLGAGRRILNGPLFTQYHQWLKILACQRELNDAQTMAVVYYLLLQDRVEMALRFFDQVNPERLSTKIQYDYFRVCVSFYREDLETARAIAEKHQDHPVDRWRLAFAQARAQLDEIAGRATQVVDPQSRDQTQAQLASQSPVLGLRAAGQGLRLEYENLQELQLRYYVMDVELLFSRNPFVQQQGGRQFAYIEPNVVKQVKLPQDKSRLDVALPDELRNKNVLVEARAEGVVRTLATYAHSMSTQLVERYGMLVAQDELGKPLPKVYVKVYARMNSGQVQFYKDGYTDLRGRFDYTSLSTNQLEQVQRFALLVLSEDHGAKVMEAAPPAR